MADFETAKAGALARLHRSLGVHRSSRQRTLRIAAALVVLAVLPLLVLSSYAVQVTTLFLPLAILAISVDLLWGENRLISFGHGAFFAAGGYVGGLILLGHTYNPISTTASFLQSGSGASGLDQLLSNLHSAQIGGAPFLALIVPPLVVGLVGLGIGLIVFRVTEPEIYVPLVTLGIGVVAELWFNDFQNIGGANGLGGIPAFTNGNTTPQYVFNAIVLLLVIAGYAWFRRSRMGVTWRALGDDPLRLEALGYPVRRMRAFGFGASAALAAFAGSLYGAAIAVIGPGLSDITFSAQPLIWIAVGGTGTLLGPVFGAIGVQWMQQVLSTNLGLQNDWQLFLGLILIGIVLLAPDGLFQARLGTLRARFPRLLMPAGRSPVAPVAMASPVLPDEEPGREQGDPPTPVGVARSDKARADA